MPKPVLEPAAVVRVWIAPYITDRGDMRYPGYVFSEITPRRWSYGEEAIKDARIITPLQIEPRESGNFVSATRDDSDDTRVATPVPPSVQKLQQLTPLRMGSPQPASPASNRASSPMTPTN
jgi:conjugal transfer pilus assembly protein TraV